MRNNFFVFDTNALVSAFLTPESASRIALNRATEIGSLVISELVLQEFSDVIFRKKFDKYFFTDEERFTAIHKIASNALVIAPSETITVCRAPKDNKFLELAVTAKASCIITGDSDLLILHPFREIPIVNASDFLDMKF